MPTPADRTAGMSATFIAPSSKYTACIITVDNGGCQIEGGLEFIFERDIEHLIRGDIYAYDGGESASFSTTSA